MNEKGRMPEGIPIEGIRPQRDVVDWEMRPLFVLFQRFCHFQFRKMHDLSEYSSRV